MLFNSIEFVIFLPIVFIMYWAIRYVRVDVSQRVRLQNTFLLIASYFFYGYADWKMLPILIVATLVFYYLGKAIATAKNERQGYWLTFSGVTLGIGTLLYFKYFNFFIASFATMFEACGLHTNLHTFNIIMPLGISFFTFRLLSYVIDIYRGKIEPTDDIISFGTYVAFFPCILSGPIDRPQFIKQLQAERAFNYDQAADGMRQILWGLFKKIVIADNCADYVNRVWSTCDIQGGSTLLLAAILFLFQIYGDFSGYSDMAIGVGKLFGLKIADNFKFPLFALNIADYWRRWHITLTSWLTDYVFMPLNIKFRDWGNWGMILSIIITFVLIGMWHGADWTFALFGLYHGILYIPLILSGAFFKKAKLKTNKFGLPIAKDFGRIVLTSILVIFGLILFRADNMDQAWDYVSGLCNLSVFSIPQAHAEKELSTICMIVAMIIVEWLQRNKRHGLELNIPQWYFRYPIYFALIFCIMYFYSDAVTFIYFQF